MGEGRGRRHTCELAAPPWSLSCIAASSSSPLLPLPPAEGVPVVRRRSLRHKMPKSSEDLSLRMLEWHRRLCYAPPRALWRASAGRGHGTCGPVSGRLGYTSASATSTGRVDSAAFVGEASEVARGDGRPRAGREQLVDAAVDRHLEEGFQQGA
jgi:hypothetical protein